LRAANQLVSRVARETEGLAWDEETREIFTPSAWDQQRLDTWVDESPDISEHTVIHAYNTGDYVRAITLGMIKFGLPDIVVEDISWSRSDQMSYLINLFGQALAEGATIEQDDLFDLDINEIQNSAVREMMLASLKPNSTATALLSLQEGTWEEGDPFNRLIEITFDRYSGPDLHARQEEMLSSLFGWEDSMVDAEHDEELLTASERARAKLPALREAFNKGLKPGEYILLKAPFETPEGGHEWMWVEVISWKGHSIEGLLASEPRYVPDLQAGQIVQVDENDIFDYFRIFPDGTEEGNETGKILEQRSKSSE
jgi:uncharacterized protein YegJ (DUF2314 family)